jgi:hypothetical protein
MNRWTAAMPNEWPGGWEGRLQIAYDPGHEDQRMRAPAWIVGRSPADQGAADIGIAIGSGTEVAKNAGRMILSDESFATDRLRGRAGPQAV